MPRDSLFPQSIVWKVSLMNSKIESVFMKTYAEHTRAEQINAKTVASASVGPPVPKTQKVASLVPAAVLLLLDQTRSAFMLSHIWSLNELISSRENLRVPWPFSVCMFWR